MPLFSLRNRRDAGVGEILDLIPLVRWGASFGQRVVQLLPINETAPGEASPYNALSAFAIDPLYISLHAVRDAPPIVAAAPEDRRLPRESIRATKMASLARAFEAFAQARASSRWRRFERFRKQQGEWLEDYALFRALKDEQALGSWEGWPLPLRDRDPDALMQARRVLAERIDVLCFAQWVAAEQWAKVRRAAQACRVWLKGDLPFVISRDSADVWAHQDEFDPQCSVGAPPDEFSATGQSWGLPMYDWERIRANDFSWWRRRARQARELYDMFRIDHIIGFFRTYSIPDDPARERGFVPLGEAAQREQGESFLRAVIEASEGALPIAEDLGTVPDWVRQTLHRFGVPGYKVFRWERRDSVYFDPRDYDAISVATTGTHDTDSLVEWWRGLSSDERDNALAALGIDPSPSAEMTSALHREVLGRLYQAGSAFVILPLQDLFRWTERINVPGTPSPENWNWRLLRPVEDLAADPAVQETTRTLRQLVRAAQRGMAAGATAAAE